MKVAIIYNKDMSGVINTFGMQNKEIYSPNTIKKVAEALESGGHNVAVIDGNINVIENLQHFMPKVIEGENLGMVFNMAYGIQGESRYTHIPSLLEMLGIPYIGSSPSGHALALDKVITKIIMQKHNIPTPDFWVFSSHEEDLSTVKFPVIVKPKMESVSFGLKVVYNIDDLREAVKFIIEEFDQQALVEQFITGREFAVGLLGNSPVETFPVLEIDLGGDPNAIQTVDDKQHKPKNKICPANIPDDLAEKLKHFSIEAFRALQLRDFARVDIRVDQNNNIYLLEINSMASLGLTGSYVHSANAYGLNYNTLINKMLDVAVVRYFANSILLSDKHTKNNKISLPVKIRGYLRSRAQFAEKLLNQITDINTYVRNVEGVNRLGDLMKKQLNLLDFTSEIFPQNEIGNVLFFTNTIQTEYDILLLCNLDSTTKIGRHEYFYKSEQKFYGTGVWENKGGLVSMLLALQSLKYARLLKKQKIGILLTTDDALQGRISQSIIQQKTIPAKYIIGLHGAFLNGGIVTSRSGAAVYKCSMNLRKNDNAGNVSKAVGSFSHLIKSWTDLSDEESGVVIAPSELTLNTNITEPYAHAEVSLSIRFNKNPFTDIDKKIRKYIPQRNKDLFQYQFEGGLRRPAMEYCDEIDNVWQKLKNIAKKLDIRLQKEHRWSSADIAFTGANRHMVDGLGPVGIKEHKKAEYILKHSLTERAALLAMFINELD